MMGRPAKPRQIALDLGHGTARSRDDLVVTEANAEAAAMIDRWPVWPAPILVVVGPPGSGKTHLASIWRDRAGASTLPANRLGEALPGALTAPVLIEDADAGSLDETGLFHLLNAARAAGAHVLITAQRPPSAWNVQLPDLASRLKLAAVTELATPDDALLAGAMVKLFADRQVEIEPAVADFVLRRIERSLPAVAEAVEKLDRAAMEGKSPITRALAASILPLSVSTEG